MAKKIPLEEYLVKKGIVLNTKKAHAQVLAGNVISPNKKFASSKELVSTDDNIYLKKPLKKYVSRGGDKIASVFDAFNIDLTEKNCLDLGASTGGFTDFLLLNDAKQVICIDVGYGILDYKLQQDPRVINIERTNIKELTKDSFWEILSKENAARTTIDYSTIDLIVGDLSFISLKAVLPFIKSISKNNTEILLLFKPQFEAKRNTVPAGGIIEDKNLIKKTLRTFLQHCKQIGFECKKTIPSNVKGTKGNQEIFVHLVLR